MGFFKMIFGENRSKWAAIKKKTTLDFKIVTGFFMVDNISFEQFIENWRAFEKICNSDSDEITFTFSDENDPSPSKTFAENYKSVKDLPLYHYNNPWFFVGYPDVCVWISKDITEIDNLIEANSYKFFDGYLPNLSFYRFVIDMYVRKYGKLELSVK
jgi:hypothetical protein